MKFLSNGISRVLLGALWFSTSANAVSAEEIRPVDPTHIPTVSTYPAAVLHSILQEMGLELPPEYRGGEIPIPTPPEGDDFFSDDSFFDDDVGFDEIVDQMDEEFDETVEAWDEEYEKQVAKWEQARAAYLEQESRYRSATIPLESRSISPETSLRNDRDLSSGIETSNIEKMEPGAFHLIPHAMSLPVRNQQHRGTCTAFSGVRALETLMIQNGFAADFSEQHFYYLSKPGCSKQPCDARQQGSSVDAGLMETKGAPTGLLNETDCPYIPSLNERNITFAPLSNCRENGVVRAGELRPLRSLDQVLVELRNNRPIVVGFSVSDSYSRNRGLVRYYDNAADSGKDDGGHANLLIGYIKLPPSLAREGDYCIITVNSWSHGWGRGGYACLTEKWLQKNFRSATSVRSAILTEAGLKYYDIR